MWNENLFMTREQIREYDRKAIEDMGMPGVVLMENAGAAAAKVAFRMCTGKKVAVLAGPGNNGGDGFVIARHLMNLGVSVSTYLAGPSERILADAKINFDILLKMGGVIFDAEDDDELECEIRASSLIVDALLGTGVTREVEGRMSWLIDLVNSSGVPVLSVDLPSGLDADTGRPHGKSVRAAATVTFGHLKRGLVLYPGRELAGKIEVAPIGAPCQVSEASGFDGAIVSEKQVRAVIPARRGDSHKGTFGHLLVVGGSPGKTGAAAMSGQAAMRVGVGLVTIATSSSARAALEHKCMEAMVETLFHDGDSPSSLDLDSRIAALLDGKKAVALGPGLSTVPAAAFAAIRLLQSSSVPIIVDADGINILSADKEAIDNIAQPMVLTPHPGEMARLVQTSVQAVQADRIGISRETAVQHQIVLVLKGAGTVVAAPDGRVFVNPTGNPGMASGGMGDVLSGIIGGFLAQGLSPLDASLLGVYLHGLAGDKAAAKTSEAGLLASDVIEEVPLILRDWEVG